MATPSHITMLREISAAGDRERTGALDVEWDGAHATLFFMFGHPSHVVYETADGRALVGEPALDAFVDELPAEFRVAPWRRAMVADDTLHCTAEDLMGLFQRRNVVTESNGHASGPPAPPAPVTETPVAVADAPSAVTPAAPPPATEQPPFGLVDFPLLPLAPTLWTDAAANVINLEAAVPRLPDSLIVLSGPTCQGVAIISGGRVTDAVWVNVAGGSLGDEAAHAVMNSLEGTLTAYRFDDPALATALPMLWRSPPLGVGLPGGWLHTDEVVAEVRTSGRSCGLVADSPDPGVALFASGELVAVYTAAHRWPATTMASLRDLLHQPGTRVRVLGPPDGSTTDAAPAETSTDSGPALEHADPGNSDVEATAAIPADEPRSEAPEGVNDTVPTPTIADADTEPDAAAAAESDIAATTEATTTDATEAVATETVATEAAATEAVATEADATEADATETVATETVATEAVATETVATEQTAPTFETTDAVYEPSAVILRTTPEADDTPVAEDPSEEATPAVTEEATEGAQPRSRGRRGRGRGRFSLRSVETSATGTGEPEGTDSEPGPVAVADGELDAEASGPGNDAPAAAEPEPEPDPEPASAVDDFRFEPAVFSIAELTPEPVAAETAAEIDGMAGVEAREATEFVPARLDIDVDGLRAELTDIATVWLGEDDAAPVAQAIAAARPGVDDFVATIRAIGAMEIPGHESAVVRAMAREMHFRASEVLCGV